MAGGKLLGVRVLALMIVVAFAFSFAPKLVDEPVTQNVAAAGEDYVSMGTLSSVVYWNPLNIQMVEDYIVTYLVYSSLVTYDENWEGPVNDLATGYWQEVHANGSMTTYINISTEAYFRGIDNIDDTSEPLDARDVSYTYNLIKNNSGGTFDWYIEELSYFTAHFDQTGSGKWDQVRTWCPYQKATLMDDISATPILPMHIWGPDGKNYEARALSGMQPDEQIGSGPFVFEDWERDSWYMFKTAPNYHGEADYGSERTVSIPGVLYNVVSDTQAMCIEVNKGVLDCGVLTGDYNAFKDVLGVGASVDVYKAAVAENGITDIAINAIPDAFDAPNYLDRHEALEDPFVRKAIHMTLNRDYIVNDMLGGLPVEAHSVVQPGFWQADIQNKVEYDPAGAKAMLVANGWADSDGDGWLEATATAYGVVEGMFDVGTELSGIRCQAVDTDSNYGLIATAWPGWADDAGIQLIGSIETETTMVNEAWYRANYDIWVWHWGWGPEPIGGALSVWLTSEIEKAGDNCEMPMGPWWAHAGNYTECEFIDQAMIDKYGIDDPDTWNGRFSAFDQNITDAWRILDVDERKVILDKLQQWVYDSNTELIPYYDLGLYGYNDYRFDNWGDWEAHNGLAVVNGLPWIWFMLEPQVDRKPVFNVPPETTYTAYEEVAEAFSVAVSDDEGSPLYVNFTFGDGDVESVYLTGDTTVAQWANVTHTYALGSAGEYTLSVSLTDGFKEDDVVRNLYREAMVEVLGEPNDPATIDSVTRDPLSPATVGQEVTWTATATDPDSGTKATGLKFTWDWGDSTYSVETTATVPDDTPVTSTQMHSWSVPDEYDVTISVYDEYGSELGEHNVSATFQYTIIVNEPPADPTVQSIIGNVDSQVTCTASSSDVNLEDLTFTWEWDDGTFDVDVLTPDYAGQTLTSIVTHEWSAEGFYDVTVWVEDEAAHNVSTAVVAEIMSGNVPPTSILLDWAPDPIYVGVSTTFNVSAEDAEGDAITFTVELGDGEEISGTTDGGITARQYWEFPHTYELDGTYAVNITADDGDRNTTTSVSVTVGVNSPPDLVILDNYGARWGEPVTIQPLEVSDPDDDELTVWYDWGDESEMSVGDPDDEYAATHTYDETGVFTLTVYADDGKAPEHNVSKTSTVTVSESNTQAALERITLSPVKDEYSIDEIITFSVVVSDLEGDSVTVHIDFGDGETDERAVDLVAKEDKNVTFEHAYDSDDEYVVNATVDDGELHEDPTLPWETITVNVGSDSNILLYIGAVLGILVAVVVVAMLLMKRKKKGVAEVPSDMGGMEGMAPPEEQTPP